MAAYWWWRDRKGLLGNPASLAANLVSAAFPLGLFASGGQMQGTAAQTGVVSAIIAVLLLFQALSLAARMESMMLLPIRM